MTGIRGRYSGLAALVGAGLVACGLVASAAAHGRVSGGVYFDFGPPAYGPPVYAAPFPGYRPYYPPHYGAPSYVAPAPAASEGCYAGPYVCPLEGPAQVGMPCSCPTVQGRAWGQAR